MKNRCHTSLRSRSKYFVHHKQSMQTDRTSWTKHANEHARTYKFRRVYFESRYSKTEENPDTVRSKKIDHESHLLYTDTVTDTRNINRQEMTKKVVLNKNKDRRVILRSRDEVETSEVIARKRSVIRNLRCTRINSILVNMIELLRTTRKVRRVHEMNRKLRSH